ncbi:MAG: hypothetical protein HON65_11265 [Rhodospirillales bacterium]|jgi:hypothetical protein|nr:hypothetical protein [Rhodospirillales bacterium]
MKAIAPYAIGGALMSAGAMGIGTVVLLYGVLRDWRFWLLGLAAFWVGFHFGR